MESYGALLKKAVRAGKDRNYPEAIKILTKIVTESDEYPEAYLYLGRSFHALKEYSKAILYLSFFKNERPDSPAGHFYLGRAYLAAGIYPKAIPHLERATVESSSPKPTILLGIAYLKAKQFENAVEYLGRAVERDPENQRVYIGYLNALLIHGLRRFHADDFEMARQILQFLADRDLESVTVFLYLAKSLRELGLHREAAVYYRRASDLEDEDQLIKLQLADSLFAAGGENERSEASQLMNELSSFLPDGENFSLGRENVDPFLAVKNFQNGDYHKAVFHGCQSLKQKRDADMHLLVGESYRNTGNLDRAENHFSQVLKARGDSSEAQIGLAMVSWQRGAFDEMIKRLEGLLGNRAYGDIARYYTVLCKCALEYPAEALLSEVQEEVRQSGPDPFILTALGNQYIRNGRPELAVKWYQKALQINETHLPAKNGLIACYQATDARDELIDLYRDILLQDESDIAVRSQLVELYYEDERYEEAAVEAEHLLSRVGDDLRLQRLLAICYRRTKRYKDAAVIYRELLKADPESEIYLRSLLYCLDKSRRRKKAILLLESALEYLTKPSASLSLIHGVLLHKEKDVEGAMAAFREAMNTAPKDWRAYYNIGKIYREKGLTSFADKFSKKAEELKISEKQT